MVLITLCGAMFAQNDGFLRCDLVGTIVVVSAVIIAEVFDHD